MHPFPEQRNKKQINVEGSNSIQIYSTKTMYNNVQSKRERFNGLNFRLCYCDNSKR